jgi:branched-subunit amino acid aminotransferase/4-amino-4-deoxychorismate lyase
MPYAVLLPKVEARWRSNVDRPAGQQQFGSLVLKEHGIALPADCPPRIVAEVVRIVSLLWLNGKVVPRDRFFIDPSDEGLLFARGLWECTRIYGGVPWLWPLHIERLLRTAALLEIDVGPERLPDSKQVADFVRGLTSMDVLVRLNVTAGKRGKPGSGIVWMTAALPPAPLSSIRLQSARTPVLKGQPYLSWKTFQYGSRLLAGQQAQRAGFDSALLVDPEGNLLEAAHANIFIRLQSGWATPAAEDGGLLPGTVRQHLLANAPLPIREQPIPCALLSEVSEAFISNSNVGIVPVVQIDDQSFPIGSETVQLLRWLHPAGRETLQLLERQAGAV